MLENEVLQIILLLDKGGEPVRWLHKPSDTDLIWHTRAGLLPAHSLYPDYQMSYLGGWQEMLPEVSETHYYRGALVHRGESAVTPWEYEVLHEDREGLSVRLTNRIRSLPLVIEKTIILTREAATIRMEETVWNESSVPMEFNWGHHLAFGAPFLTTATLIEFAPGSKVLNPATQEVWDWPYASNDGSITDLSKMASAGTQRELLAVESLDGVYRLCNGSSNGAISLEVKWDREVWPFVWFWQNFAHDSDAPFFASEYNIGLEPFNVPPKWTLAEAAAKGAALSLEPQGSLTSFLEISVVERRTQDEASPKNIV
ncbi:DUF4432 family protein [Paenibacillus sp. UNC451MF]|uniref:DUF4432 family protein n=1 Tax=Paenibacillus sp. UNC451MF TaxID=1449063 RepID=UPI0018CC1F93|nr:DUF4432 family protein [Paenibacillus sp. UNC451MF]